MKKNSLVSCFLFTITVSISPGFSQPRSMDIANVKQVKMPVQELASVLNPAERKDFDSTDWKKDNSQHRAMLLSLLEKLPKMKRAQLHNEIGDPSITSNEKKIDAYVLDHVSCGTTPCFGLEIEFKNDIVRRYRISHYPEGVGSQIEEVSRWYVKSPKLRST